MLDQGTGRRASGQAELRHARGRGGSVGAGHEQGATLQGLTAAVAQVGRGKKGGSEGE